MSREVFSVSADEFRRACGRFATGVTVATVVDSQGAPHGLTVSSFTSVSLDPPLVLICLGHGVTVIDIFRNSSHFGINVLSADQRPISDRFARKGLDRFADLAWERGATGVPLLPGVLAAIECAVHERFTSGDHDIFVGRMVHAKVAAGAPLLYFASDYRDLSA